MKPSIVVLAALAAASVVALAQPPRELEQAWFKSGQDPDSYVIGVDDGGYHRGGNAKFIRHNTGKPGEGEEWATLMQAVSAENYRGKRVRFSAQVRTHDVTGWAGLWMRVDQPNGESVLYNSQDKPIKGTSDWQRRSVVLDVARDAQSINFGVIDGGTGQVWIDDLRFEVVGDDVPADRGYHSAKPQRKPSL